MTWASYALIVSACLVVYCFIILFFYRKKSDPSVIKATGSANVLSHFTSDEVINENPKSLNLFGEEVMEEESLSVSEEQDFSTDAQDFTDEIMAYTSSCSDSIEKDELLHHLKRIILKYPSLADSESTYELNQLILISTENNCSIHLSADELSELWNG